MATQRAAFAQQRAAQAPCPVLRVEQHGLPLQVEHLARDDDAAAGRRHRRKVLEHDVQRVGIARAIVNKPKYIFYDEPTTGLDPVNSGRIDELMNTLAQEQGRTSIIITHDMYTVKTIATQVAMIHDRRLHFHGTPKEFLDSQDPEIQRFLARA